MHHIGEGSWWPIQAAVGRGVYLDALGAGLLPHLRGADGRNGGLVALTYFVGVSDGGGS